VNLLRSVLGQHEIGAGHADHGEDNETDFSAEDHGSSAFG
jgi:hypothetical protein